MTQTRKPPILFADGDFGVGAGNNTPALLLGLQGNYQFNKNLLTARLATQLGFNAYWVETSPFTVIPFPYVRHNNVEIAAMYGRRHIFRGFSVSYSAGPAYNFRRNRYYARSDTEGVLYRDNTNYPGVAFDVRVKVFKNNKQPFRIFYGLIPVTPPTAIGRNWGLSLTGNVASRYSYIGLSLTGGYGIHKDYD